MRRFDILLFLPVALGCLCSASYAFTRDQAVEYAMENAETIRIVKQNAVQTRESGRQSVAFLKPSALLSGEYVELDTNAPEIPIPELAYPDRNIRAGAELTQLLFAGGRIWRSLELEKNLYRQADQQETTGIRDIVKQVKLAFDQVLFQDVLVKILQDREAQRRIELEDARDLWNAGMVTLLDVRQARLNLNFSMDALKTGEALREDALVDFNVTLGRPGDGELLVPEGSLKETESLGLMIGQLHELLEKEEFLDIELRKSQAETARLNYQIAKSDYYPRLQFIAASDTRGESTDDMYESWRVGLQMEWSILDGGLIRSRAAEAVSKLRNAEDLLERTKKELAGRVKKVVVNFQTLQKRATLQQEALKLAEENYEDARGQYRAGTITLTRLGEFNLNFSESRFRLLEIYFEQRRLMAEAEALLEKQAMKR